MVESRHSINNNIIYSIGIKSFIFKKITNNSIPNKHCYFQKKKKYNKIDDSTHFVTNHINIVRYSLFLSLLKNYNYQFSVTLMLHNAFTIGHCTS